jgi:argonaute-like protein implicated in RNA metabolism and viral defense
MSTHFAGSLTKSDKISQGLLRDLDDVRRELALKKKQKSELNKEIERLGYEEELNNYEIINLLNQGHKVSRGKFLAMIRIKEVLPRVAWKQVFIKIVPNGEAKAQKIMDERETNKTKYVELSMRG